MGDFKPLSQKQSFFDFDEDLRKMNVNEMRMKKE